MSAWTYCLQDGKAAPKIVPPRLRIPCWKGLGADSEEKHEPASDINTEGANSLKALDPKRPIREEAELVDASDLKCLATPERSQLFWKTRFRVRHQPAVSKQDLENIWCL